MTQRDWWDDLPTTLSDAVVARDEALENVEQGAGEEWVELATAWLRNYLETHLEYNPDVVNQEGPQPPERRAWGIITRRAIQERWIERTGYAPRTRGHATMGPVYESRICRVTVDSNGKVG